MTTANREKIYACDYCGSDYTDAKYCCAARREYLNAHGKFETGRAPAASVGDAPSDAVAWQTRLTYPGGMVGGWDNAETEELADRRVMSIRELGDDRYSIEKRALYTAPPAAPVVSATVPTNLIEQLRGCVPAEAKKRDTDGLTFGGVIAASDWLIASSAYSVRCVDERMAYGWNQCREAMLELIASLPTDDKAPAVDAEPFGVVCLTPDGYANGCMLEVQLQVKQGASLKLGDKLYLHPPTSPHDVDAVRVDEAMVERAMVAFREAAVNGRSTRHCVRRVLTAALRKPGEA